ncbi:GAF domain-containing protein [Staphylococcus pettenkoferi]|uniref:GAF domain-containing protein n=1 Tax=Staphylococcus pettenkoferi TaxID=170573 RepID=UPI00066AB502|nr:GAF domain-containing protein [Staphylococcus pettenkoferi]MCI2804021.1 GAF domain-containing protein [Staphylococcus pettenkoferi]MCY1586404.1 GAF domain-containing protein [Staphylococcus pettenkoferi]MCY1616000.1 GAF domain-containing protein [Staphylococcus pettenkoferi]MCY1627469.1 GAF domain-containing protein [Staphylococcus pettenkoferi]PNZ86966.1 GAF domain-containing protein [Staphylococcus pettenkoferi]
MTQYSTTNYRALHQQLKGLLDGEHDLIAILSNASALINDHLDNVNWVGFYLVKNEELLLGPFQGHPACVHIPIGKGVCGTAVSEGAVQRVDDVNAFPGHIACDPKSQSEIVVPIRRGVSIIGVLDIDAPVTHRFTETDAQGLKDVVTIIEDHLA